MGVRLILALSLGGKKSWQKRRKEIRGAKKDKCGQVAAAPQADALLVQHTA